jgi:hypothetical protein
LVILAEKKEQPARFFKEKKGRLLVVFRKEVKVKKAMSDHDLRERKLYLTMT